MSAGFPPIDRWRDVRLAAIVQITTMSDSQRERRASTPPAAPAEGRSNILVEPGAHGEVLIRLDRHLSRVEQEVGLARDCYEILLKSAGSGAHWVRDGRGFACLTPRERRVAILIAEGCSNSQIAVLLQVSVHTIKSQVRGILNKLDLHSRWQVAGLIAPASEQRPAD